VSSSAEGTRAASVRAARRLLEESGPEALTMRRIAAELGIQAPSLYKHFPDKRALEAAVIAEGLREFGLAMNDALTTTAEPVRALARAYRRFGLDHPHLYRLMNDGELPRDLLPPGLEDAAAHPILTVFGKRSLARVAWALAHGLVSLELAGRFPPDADLDQVWEEAISVLRAAPGQLTPLMKTGTGTKRDPSPVLGF
jgi:AcrR family transcriptional regulator